MNSPQQQILSNATPNADQIKTGLVMADDPMAFIQANLKPENKPQTPVTVTPSTAQAVADTIVNGAQELPLMPPVEKTALKEEPPTKTPEPPAQPTAEELLAKVTPTKEDSVRALAKKVKAVETEVAERDARISELLGTVEKYKTGEAIPEVVTELTNKLAELERFRDRHEFKFSKEYQKTIAEPRVTLDNKAVALAKEYEIPKEILDKASELKKPRERNAFLEQYFDIPGVLKANELLGEINALEEQAQKYETAPKESLALLRSQVNEQEQVENRVRAERIANNSRSGWIDSLIEVQKGDYPELVMKEGDEEHNAYSRPVLENASKEYGKFIKLLSELGVKDLPKEAAKIIAKRFQLSEAAAVMAQSRASHYQRAEDLLATTKRQTALSRPRLGGTVNGGGVPPSGSSRAKSPTEAADQLLSQVMQKR